MVDPAARSQLAVSVTVRMFISPGKGVLCWMYFSLKLGTTTIRGSEPLGTPYNLKPVFGISQWYIEPTRLLLSSSISADTLTKGDNCAVAGFFNLNTTSYAAPACVPCDVAFNTNFPEVPKYVPTVPYAFDVEDRGKTAESSVCEPDTVPPAAVVSTSCPELCVQTPRVPKRSNVDVTCSVDVSNVCDPVSPEMVTVDPLARS